MQIVIKIPDLDYFDIKHGHADNFQRERLVESVKCSIAIPKNHGKLKDADELGLTDFEIVMCDGDYKKGLKMLCEKIENAPTILDAEVGDDEV